MRAEDVSIGPVSIAAMTRQSFAIRVATSGQYSRFVLPGPSRRDAMTQAPGRSVLAIGDVRPYLPTGRGPTLALEVLAAQAQ
jgi:hypothetical protein